MDGWLAVFFAIFVSTVSQAKATISNFVCKKDVELGRCTSILTLNKVVCLTEIPEIFFKCVIFGTTGAENCGGD